jgi:nicotinamide riboside transporter PnuC
MESKKPFWKSRTIILNIVAAIVATAIEHDNPLLVTQVLAVLNIVLRALTKEPISFSGD